MGEIKNKVYVTVKSDRLDYPSMTEGQFVEVIFVVADSETKESMGFATFRFLPNNSQMSGGETDDLFYITKAQHFFKLCSEADLLFRPDLRKGNQGVLMIVNSLDERIRNNAENESIKNISEDE